MTNEKDSFISEISHWKWPDSMPGGPNDTTNLTAALWPVPGFTQITCKDCVMKRFNGLTLCPSGPVLQAI